eukprot:jgi/Tetstr1/461129/TSEL_006268.t1
MNRGAVRGAHVAGAASPEEILRVAELLLLPGEEQLHWQRQDVHHRRRLSAASHALRRLAKFMAGQGAEKARRALVQRPEFHRLCQSAAQPAPEEGDTLADVALAVDALTSLGSLAPIPPSVLPWASQLLQRAASMAAQLQPRELSGCGWACARLGLEPPAAISAAADAAQLPFCIVPALLEDPQFNLPALVGEVPFQAEMLVTRTGKRVQERRETCWMAEAGIGGLAYSGKIMQPVPFTPLVRKIRDQVHDATAQYFDCALLNLYPDEETACKWHSDPDHGRLWATDTVVVSIGETRRFNFREIMENGTTNAEEPHSFRLFHGDAVWMMRDCQDAFQHCVMRAEGEGNRGPRVSLVFKRALVQPDGRRGHGAGGAQPRTKGFGSEARGGRREAAPRDAGADVGGRGRGRGGGRAGRGRGRGRGALEPAAVDRGSSRRAAASAAAAAARAHKSRKPKK